MVQMGAWPRSLDLLFKFLDPPEWLKIQNSYFANRFQGKGYLTEKRKFGQRGAWPRSRDLLFKFCYPANISGTAEDTNQKFSRATSKFMTF